jgi:hypothetical protein
MLHRSRGVKNYPNIRLMFGFAKIGLNFINLKNLNKKGLNLT